MNKLDLSLDEHLRKIQESCPRLLNALQYSPEAIWGEIQAIELACKLFEECFQSLSKDSQASVELMVTIAALRSQMGKGLMDGADFTDFRAKVEAIQARSNALRNELRIRAHSPFNPNN